MTKLPNPIQDLINELNKLPGIGPKTSERFVFFLLKQPKKELEKLSCAVQHLKDKIKLVFDLRLEEPYESYLLEYIYERQQALIQEVKQIAQRLS